MKKHEYSHNRGKTARFVWAVAAMLTVFSLCACAPPGSESTAPPAETSGSTSTILPTAPPEPEPPTPAPDIGDLEGTVEYYLPPDDLPPYEIEPITQQRYDADGTYLEFNDLPETDAETLVCDDFLANITGELRKNAARYLPGPYLGHYPTQEEEDAYDPAAAGIEWTKINRVEELTLDALRTEAPGIGMWETVGVYPTLFRFWHEQRGGELSYDEYVETIYGNGCTVVAVDYENRYTDEKRAGGPQLADGVRVEYWLVVPNEDGLLKLAGNTRFYGEYSVPHYEELVPQAMLAE